MGSKINRLNEKNINNCGSEMVIIQYRRCDDIDIYFPQYDWVARGKAYREFQKGAIKCPYEPRFYRKGFIGEGQYRITYNKKQTKCYNTWCNMLKRCYSEEYHKKKPTYRDCKVCDEWLNFQNFAKWYEENYYKIANEEMHLDKDILYKGNKLYSPNTCVFVPKTINSLFVKCNSSRNNLPIGVNKYKDKFSINYSVGNKYMSVYNLSNEDEAFKQYKIMKETYIKQIADEYKELIPNILYNALYRYEVEITD